MSVNIYDKENDKLNLVAGGTLYADSPIGSIIPYGGNSAPSGWLLCQGQAISRTEYANLFNAIGTNFGTGDGSTTFNLPDLRNRAAMGAGTNGALGESQEDTTAKNGLSGATSSAGGHSHSVLAYTGGKAAIANVYPKTIIASNMEAYAGAYVANADYGGTSRPYIEAAGDHTHPVSISSTDSETRPKNVRVNYIIKAKHTPIPADFMDAVNECKILPYEFNKSSNVSAFNRKWLVTGSPLVWTATHTGRLTVRCLKHGDGYSLYLSNQSGVLLDSYDNFFGDETHGLTVSDASITLQAWVRKGDVIKLETNLPADTDWADKYFVQLGLLAYNNNFD